MSGNDLRGLVDFLNWHVESFHQAAEGVLIDQIHVAGGWDRVSSAGFGINDFSGEHVEKTGLSCFSHGELSASHWMLDDFVVDVELIGLEVGEELVLEISQSGRIVDKTSGAISRNAGLRLTQSDSQARLGLLRGESLRDRSLLAPSWPR